MMDDNRPRGLKVWTPLLFSLILILGMAIGFNLRDTLRNKRDIQTIIQRNDRLEQVIDLVNERYVDSVNTNVLYEDAINGIFSHLDPHTIYIPADEYEDMNENLDGSFFGIGVEFSIIRDTIQVTSVVEGGPAESAGVQLGDQLIKVGDSVVAGTGITSDRIMKMLKGKQYSRVFVTLKEPGKDEMRQTSIKRDVVPLYSLDAGIMLDSVTGYIKINRFSATTYNEFDKSLKALIGSGAKQFIVDLRQNPGGYLNAATNIADEFLDDEKLIVYTEGKRAPREDYKASRKGQFERGRLVILVDESSASASEILAGAIQDWDRGVIIGRRSYGKGLVQEQYNMDDGSGIRLTIAKYYTPSGRSIQRSFAMGRDAYAQEFAHRFETGELTGKGTISNTDTNKFYTSQRRIVYGGGGINPDIFVPYDATKYTAGLLNFVFSDDVKNFVWDYFIRNRAALSNYKNAKGFIQNFHADELTNKYIQTLDPSLRKAALEVMKDSLNYKYFRLQMKAQLARILYHDNGYYAVTALGDNMIEKSLEVLYSKKYSEIIGR
jgi:carboxyl-terminal processing protease